MCDFNIEFDKEKVFEEIVSCIEFKNRKQVEIFETWLDKQGIGYSYNVVNSWNKENCCFEFAKNNFQYCRKQWFIDNNYKIYQFEDVILNNKNNKKEIKKEMNNTIEKYEFKGKFNVDLICNDLFRAMKRSAVIIGKENALVVVSHNYINDLDEENTCWEVTYENNNFKEYKSSNDYDIAGSYFFKIIPKKDANDWIQILRDENKRYNKMILKMKDKNRKLMKQGKNKKDHFRVFLI